MTLAELWNIFRAKMRGHIQYYAISHNLEQVAKFIDEALKMNFKWLNRRSQRKSFTWEKFKLFIERFPTPRVKIKHHLF